MPSFAKLSKSRSGTLPSLLPRWLSRSQCRSRANSQDRRVSIDADARKLQPKERRLATCDFSPKSSNGSNSTTCPPFRGSMSRGSMGSMSSSSTLSVSIDESTEIPFDLYHDLMDAAKAAKQRGQHQKRQERTPGIKNTSLVATVVSCEEMGEEIGPL